MVKLIPETLCKINESGPYLCELSTRQEVIDVTPIVKRVPDFEWEDVDSNKHFHAYAADGTLPTLRARKRKKGGHRCIACGESVFPPVIARPSTAREHIAGMRSWWVTVRPAQIFVPDVPISVVITPRVGPVAFGFAKYHGDGSVSRNVSGSTTLSVTLHGISDLAYKKAS